MNKTRVALLGTFADLHTHAIQYDLDELTRVVSETQPDLLGVEIERDEFERGDLGRAPIEVREALVPLARRSDAVIVPIGAASPDELRAPQAGLRAPLTRALDAALQALLKLANDARRVNSTWVGHSCGLICHLEEHTCGPRGRQAWKNTNERMLANIIAMVERDPGTRILAAVQCRRKHWLEPKMRAMPEIELVNYWEL
ncbi:MAG: hypothetical protein HY782_17825 [Chloroflexi bacterium]|nr:hypothetical protein [Chloroflexota bacterium]